MTVIEKNSGAKIPYEITEVKICFDDDVTINLGKRQRDEAVHIDVCADRNGNLAIGTAAGWEYVAEIDIPARAYAQEGDGEEAVYTPLPLDMDRVTLTLWAIV